MALERHHKILIGSFSTLILILIITNSVFLYLLFVKLNLNYQTTNDKLTSLGTETNSKISVLADSLKQANDKLSIDIGSINKEIQLVKASSSSDFSGIIDSSIKSVVTIKTSAGFQGTGFIIEKSGYIVTNAHVVSDSSGNLASIIQAITSNQQVKTAKFIGYDGNLDIALLKIDGSYNALVLDNSDKVQVGEKVIAIGNPLGLQFSVSEGIVSAMNRVGTNGLGAYIQTDAALNPGNSGGPLINKNGKVIGINNFKIGSGESLGFALESNYIKEAVNSISQSSLKQTLI